MLDEPTTVCCYLIDRGRLRYDGDLAKLVESIRPDKRIVLTFDAPPDRQALERIGVVVEEGRGRAVLRVPKAEVREAIGHLVSGLGVHDLTVEDPPLEEVMRDLFARPAEPVGDS